MANNLRQLLARTLQAEAGNQGYDGMMDVGSVIRNRVASGRYGDGLEGVIMKPGQFSAWNGVTGYAGGQQAQDMTFEPNEDAYRAADAILQGNYEDRTGGATHYYNPDVGSGVPKWGGDHFKRIGAHVFGNAEGGPVQGNTGPIAMPAAASVVSTRNEANPLSVGRGILNEPPTSTGVTTSPITTHQLPAVEGPEAQKSKVLLEQAQMFESMIPMTPNNGDKERLKNDAAALRQEAADIMKPVLIPEPDRPESIPLEQMKGFQMVDPLVQGAEQAINASQAPTDAATGGVGGSQEGSMVSARNGSPEDSPEDSPEAKPWYENFFGFKQSEDGGGFSRLMGWDQMSQRDRDDQWLAIGTGLLSGDDWDTGLAAAGQNVLNLRQKQKGSTRGNRPMGMAVMKDGTQRADLYWDNSTSTYRDAQGNDVGSDVAEWINKSDAYGTKGQMSIVQANKMATDLIRQGHSLETFDRVIDSLEDVNYGVEGFVNELQIYYKTLLQNDLTAEEISRKAAQGELQGLVGATREQVVGGGVMTEQDAVRVIQALGGDMQGFFSNPEVGIRLLSTQRDKMLPAYQHGVEQYNYMTEAYPNIPYRPLSETYTGPSKKPSQNQTKPIQLNPEIEEILKKHDA